MNSNPLLRIGVIGTGEMGRPLVDRVLGAGHRVAAFARRAEVRNALAAAGVDVVDRAADLGADRDVVIVYVFSDDQVREVALAGGIVDAMAPGSVLVIHTTGSPATATAIAAHASRRGVGVVDAPGSGGPAQMAKGMLNLFVGGATDHVERCRRCSPRMRARSPISTSSDRASSSSSSTTSCSARRSSWPPRPPASRRSSASTRRRSPARCTAAVVRALRSTSWRPWVRQMR